MTEEEHERSLVVKATFGVSISPQLDVQMELCAKWNRPLTTLNTKKFVKKDGKYVLVPRSSVIDIFAVLNGETKYPTRDSTRLPSRQMFGDRTKGDEWKLDLSNPCCTVEVGEVQGF